VEGSSERLSFKERRQVPKRIPLPSFWLICRLLYQNLTEIPFDVIFTKPHFAWGCGGTYALSRNRRRQKRSSPRGGGRSNPGRVDQEDLQNGGKRPDPFTQDIQFNPV
jgi:hypothetical protein